MLGLKPPESGVHLQHPFMHWEFEEHCSQSPSVPGFGGVSAGGLGVGAGGLGVGVKGGC